MLREVDLEKGFNGPHAIRGQFLFVRIYYDIMVQVAHVVERRYLMDIMTISFFPASFFRLSKNAEVPNVSTMEIVVARSINRNCCILDELLFVTFGNFSGIFIQDIIDLD